MGNRQSLPEATTAASAASSSERAAAGGTADLTGMSVTGGGATGVTGTDGTTGVTGVTGTTTGADGVTGGTGVTGTSGGTVGPLNWAGANTKASGGKPTDDTTGTGDTTRNKDTTGKKEETGGGFGMTEANNCVAGGNKDATTTGKGEAEAGAGKEDEDTSICKAEPYEPAASKAASSVASVMSGDEDIDWEDPVPYDVGIDEDTDLSEECLPDPRIKESQLTAGEKAKYLGYLDKIFSQDSINGKRMYFEPLEVVDVMRGVIPYLKSEPMLIDDVPFGITVVADLHGQLHDLARVFEREEKDGKPGWECMKYLFLGDYVDRGRHSLEIVMALYCIKMLYPDRIFLLRGNHEYVKINSRYGLALEMSDRFADGIWEDLYYIVNESFCWLSSAAIIGDFYFCAHGGISPAAFTRRRLRAIRKPIYDSKDDVVINDLNWADPATGLRGTTYNGGRMTSVYFGVDELARALYNMDCGMLIRGHTMIVEGYAEIENLCLNLFTATGTSDDMNKGAIGFIDDKGKLFVITLECNKERVLWDRKLKRMDGALVDIGVENEITVNDDDIGDGKTKSFA